MPRILTIDPRVPTSYGVIIRRKALEEQTRAHITIKEARAYARRIVKQAQVDAEAIKLEAMQQGFGEGWLDSLGVICQSLRELEGLHATVERDLKQAVHQTMDKGLADPNLELQLLENWVSAAPRTSSDINIVLPRRAQVHSATVSQRVVETMGVTPSISVGDGENVVIECGDQIFEFSPSRTLEETDDLAKNCLRRLEVKKQYAAWAQHIVQHWLSDLAKRHEAPPVQEPVNKVEQLDDVDDDDLFDDDDFFDDDEDDDL
jgi:hypothetical protein